MFCMGKRPTESGRGVRILRQVFARSSYPAAVFPYLEKKEGGVTAGALRSWERMQLDASPRPQSLIPPRETNRAVPHSPSSPKSFLIQIVAVALIRP